MPGGGQRQGRAIQDRQDALSAAIVVGNRPRSGLGQLRTGRDSAALVLIEGRPGRQCRFAGIVQTMHQIDGLCFLIFAERGLWNRFVPSLDGYIQDRLNNPVHVPKFGTVKALRLEAPPADLVRAWAEALGG